LIDVKGNFKFDPKTIKQLKDNYPTAYKYLIETDNLLKYVSNEQVAKAIITNTQYYNAKKAILLKKQGLGVFTDVAAGYLGGSKERADETKAKYQLTKQKLKQAFTYDSGQEIVIVPYPGGFGTDGQGTADGYNAAHAGIEYTDNRGDPVPIQLNEKLFSALKMQSLLKIDRQL